MSADIATELQIVPARFFALYSYELKRVCKLRHRTVTSSQNVMTRQESPSGELSPRSNCMIAETEVSRHQTAAFKEKAI